MAKTKQTDTTGEPSYTDLYRKSIHRGALAKGLKAQLAAERESHAKTKAELEKIQAAQKKRDEDNAAQGRNNLDIDTGKPDAKPEEETGADGKKVARKANVELDGHGLKPSSDDSDPGRLGGGSPSRKKSGQIGDGFKL
jgi:hypothetical protein